MCLVMLGAGLVLDADRTWSGGILMLAGGIGLIREWQTAHGGERPA